jgi:hypothetical protein
MRWTLAIAGLLLWNCALAERAPSEEEMIAPLVTKQNCWGGVIKFLREKLRFEVEDALCADGSFYHLEFDEDFRPVEKRLLRKATDRKPDER